MNTIRTYLFDTNIFVDILRGVASTIEMANSFESLHISAIVLGELYYGAHYSGKAEQKLIKIEALTTDLIVMPVTKRTAELFGEIKTSLRKKGNPIPENDIWIAATAMEHDLTVLTGDKHFENIDGLKLELWVRNPK
jgi:tRNA(fMet)-specific endonuclease VapC